jgi:hypothetical protein
MRAITSLVCIVIAMTSSLFAAGPPNNAELKPVFQAIQPILDKLKPAAKIESDGATFKVTYLPQTFKIHPILMDGEIIADARDEIGPSYKGFILDVGLEPKGEVNQLVTPQTRTEPYWHTDVDITPLGQTNKQIFWALSYGSRMDEKILVEIRQKLNALSK